MEKKKSTLILCNFLENVLQNQNKCLPLHHQTQRNKLHTQTHTIMRTYSISFSETKTGNRFNYKTTNEDFRRMRAFVLMSNSGRMESCFVYRLVDVMDEIKDMKVGETKFVIASPYEVMTAKTIERFNATIAMMDEAARNELGEKYMYDQFSAFAVKRTPNLWKFSTLTTI